MDNRLGCFVALEAARLVAEAGGAPGDVYAVRGHAGGDHLRRRAHDGVLAAPGRRDRGRRDVRDRPAGHRREGARPPPASAPGRCSRAARRSTRGCSSCCTRPARPRASRSRSPPRARVDGHRRRRVPHLARRHPDRRRLGAAALHALAGRDGAARRRRERGAADRGVRAAARRRTWTSGADAAAPAALRHRRHAAAARVARARRRRCARRRGEVHGVAALDGATVEAAGRTDAAIARDLLIARAA